jgi:hypothetical protein
LRIFFAFFNEERGLQYDDFEGGSVAETAQLLREHGMTVRQTHRNAA